jgi:hypothetical protein
VASALSWIRTFNIHGGGSFENWIENSKSERKVHLVLVERNYQEKFGTLEMKAVSLCFEMRIFLPGRHMFCCWRKRA